MSVRTRGQQLAEEAFARVADHRSMNKEYVSFAKKFPALIHTCGLVQAVAFARAKGGQQEVYANDLAAVLREWILLLVGAGMLWRLFTKDQPAQGSRNMTAYFLAVLAGLAGLMWLVPITGGGPY